jgi:hypothetical protein
MRLTVAIILICATCGLSQSRLKGAKLLQMGMGFRGNSLFVECYTGKSFDKTVKALFGGGIGVGGQSGISYKYVYADGIGVVNVRSSKKSYYLNVLGGISLIGDFKGDFKTTKYESAGAFNFGALAGAEAEFVVTKKLNFVLGAMQRYYVREDFGSWRYQVSASARFNF